MSDDPEGKPVPIPPARRRKRWLVVALGVTVVSAGAALFWLYFEGHNESAEGDPPANAVYPIKHKPEPPKLGIEYHFDRNAITDSRRVGQRLVALSASGNLLAFDGDTFAVRNEKILRRRSTCLGPADQTHVLAGIANGSIVRVGAQDLAIEEVTDVPGTPRWIGKRAQDGALVIAYQVGRDGEAIFVKDAGSGRTHQVGARSIFFLDGADRLWTAGGATIFVLDLASGTRKEIAAKTGWEGVQGFVALQGQVWAFGGNARSAERSSFIARLQPDGKSTVLYASGAKRRPGEGFAPATPITQILEDTQLGRILVVSRDAVSVSDASLSTWKPLDAMAGLGREDGALGTVGQAHLGHNGVVMTLARGGFMEVTPDYTRRHVLDGQYSVVRPSEIVRLNGGVAFYGAGGPLFYAAGKWHALPDQVTPPPELMGSNRPGEKERSWAAMTTIPIEESTSYVIAKAGQPRHYIGHMHGMRDVFLTARWDGKILTVLGREELPIEPDDTFMTPDRQLWNVDDQGLWSFSGSHWRLVMRSTPDSAPSGHGKASDTPAATGQATATWASAKSAIGEPLHFVEAFVPPFYGLPIGVPSWALVRLDSNEAGGIPLIDEVPVKLDGRRLLVRDATLWGNKKEELLLATDQGLGIFNVRWGTCELVRPEGLGDKVSLFMRDGTRRLWLGGRGLWVLRDQKRADAVSPSIPMLADTDVVALAEAPDGRLVIGSADRGTVFLGVPQGWFQRPADPPVALASWEATHSHEYSYLDRGVVLRSCPDKNSQAAEALPGTLLTGLRDLARTLGPRFRVEFQANFQDPPDVVLLGDEPEKILQGVLSVLDKQGPRTRVSILKRFGPPGSAAVEVKTCP